MTESSDASSESDGSLGVTEHVGTKASGTRQTTRSSAASGKRRTGVIIELDGEDGTSPDQDQDEMLDDQVDIPSTKASGTVIDPTEPRMTFGQEIPNSSSKGLLSNGRARREALKHRKGPLKEKNYNVSRMTIKEPIDSSSSEMKRQTLEHGFEQRFSNAGPRSVLRQNTDMSGGRKLK